MHIQRQTSWLATLPQFAAIAIAVTIGWIIAAEMGIYIGVLIYLIYSFGSRRTLARHHRRGMQLTRAEKYADAIDAFNASLAFFTRHAWLDRFRSLFLMTPSNTCYREMAMVNMAYCEFHLGNISKAREIYTQTLDQFPTNTLAISGLEAIRQLEQELEESATSPQA